MEQSKVLEGNKLIAEFMDVDYEDAFFIGEGGCTYPMIQALKYHSSWDWLMLVVSKILKSNTGTLDVYSLYVSDSLCTVDILHVWECVIDFITWYNTTQSTNVNN